MFMSDPFGCFVQGLISTSNQNRSLAVKVTQYVPDFRISFFIFVFSGLHISSYELSSY